MDDEAKRRDRLNEERLGDAHREEEARREEDAAERQAAMEEKLKAKVAELDAEREDAEVNLVLRRFQLYPVETVTLANLQAWTAFDDVERLERITANLEGIEAIQPVFTGADQPQWGMTSEGREQAIENRERILGGHVDGDLAREDLEKRVAGLEAENQQLHDAGREVETRANKLAEDLEAERGRRAKMEDVAAGAQQTDAAMRIVDDLLKLDAPSPERTLESIGLLVERWKRLPRNRGDGSGLAPSMPLDIVGGFVRGLLEAAEKKVAELDEKVKGALAEADEALQRERTRADQGAAAMLNVRELVDQALQPEGTPGKPVGWTADWRDVAGKILDEIRPVLPVAIGGTWQADLGIVGDPDRERAIAAGRKLMHDLGADRGDSMTDDALERIGKAAGDALEDLGVSPMRIRLHRGGVLPRPGSTFAMTGFPSTQTMKPGLYRGERTEDGFRFVQLEESEDDAELRKVDELFGQTRLDLERQIAEAEERAGVAEERADELQAWADEVRPAMQTLVAELAGEEPAWWVRAARAVEQLRQSADSILLVPPRKSPAIAAEPIDLGRLGEERALDLRKAGPMTPQAAIQFARTWLELVEEDERPEELPVIYEDAEGNAQVLRVPVDGIPDAPRPLAEVKSE